MTRKERREYLVEKYHDGDVREMCRALGVKRRSLYKRASVLGLRRDGDAANMAKSAARTLLYQSERRRMRWGLERRTSLHIPGRKYGVQERNFRHGCARRKGYVPGDCRLPEERFVMFYDAHTTRSGIMERNGMRLGFRFEELEEGEGGEA